MNKFGRRTRLLAEQYVHAFVFLLHFRHAADDDDRNGRINLAQHVNKFRAGGVRHDVVSDHDANFLRLGEGAKEGKSAVGTGSNLDFHSCLVQHHLPCRKLNRIVVHQKNGLTQCSCPFAKLNFNHGATEGTEKATLKFQILNKESEQTTEIRTAEALCFNPDGNTCTKAFFFSVYSVPPW